MFSFSSRRTPPAREYSRLSRRLAAQLERVVPSRDGEIEYYPCRVALKDGSVQDRVYIVDADSYIRTWGVWPEDDPAKRSIPLDDVGEIEASPFRLPAALANRLYEAGESGMGYCLFTVEFRDGQRQACVTGNAVDFITFPRALTGADVVRVLPHAGRVEDPVRGPAYGWCLFRGREAE
jgi:hypothetical protein